MKQSVLVPMIFLICATSAPYAFAQSTLDDAINPFTQISAEDIEIEMTPEFPDAFQEISLRLTSNSIDLNTYLISWSVNGQKTLSGIGKRDYTFTTGNYGEPYTVNIVIQTGTSIVQKSTIILPEDITMLYEAVDSYVPPFYKGKKLPSTEAIVRVVTIPNFVTNNTQGITPETAVYIWKRNYEALPEAGGYGKDSLLIKHNRIRQMETISVTASTTDGQRASKYIDLSFFAPELVLYAKDTVTGFREPLPKREFFLRKPEVTLVAEPFFISSLTNTIQGIVVNWKVNNGSLELSDESRKNEVLVKKPASSGNAVFDVAIKGGAEYPLQQLGGRAEISF